MDSTNNSEAPKCPYCAGVLKKAPTRKTRCPHCRQYIYVRTRLQDGARVLVTEDGAKQIESEWKSERARDDSAIDAMDVVRGERSQLRGEHGDLVNTLDGLFVAMQSELRKHRAAGDWGLYRNSVLTVAAIAEMNEDWKLAFEKYLEVCFFDGNGCANNAPLSGKAFDIEGAWLTPLVIGSVASIRAKVQPLGIDTRGVLQTVYRRHSSLKPPVPEPRLWQKIDDGLRELRAVFG